MSGEAARSSPMSESVDADSALTLAFLSRRPAISAKTASSPININSCRADFRSSMLLEPNCRTNSSVRCDVASGQPVMAGARTAVSAIATTAPLPAHIPLRLMSPSPATPLLQTPVAGRPDGGCFFVMLAQFQSFNNLIVEGFRRSASRLPHLVCRPPTPNRKGSAWHISRQTTDPKGGSVDG